MGYEPIIRVICGMQKDSFQKGGKRTLPRKWGGATVEDVSGAKDEEAAVNKL